MPFEPKGKNMKLLNSKLAIAIAIFALLLFVFGFQTTPLPQASGNQHDFAQFRDMPEKSLAEIRNNELIALTQANEQLDALLEEKPDLSPQLIKLIQNCRNIDMASTSPLVIEKTLTACQSMAKKEVEALDESIAANQQLLEQTINAVTKREALLQDPDLTDAEKEVISEELENQKHKAEVIKKTVIKERKSQSDLKKLLNTLSALLKIGGVVAATLGFPQIGASMFAAGVVIGQISDAIDAFETISDPSVSSTSENTDGPEGTPTDKKSSSQAVIEAFKNEGYEQLSGMSDEGAQIVQRGTEYVVIFNGSEAFRFDLSLTKPFKGIVIPNNFALSNVSEVIIQSDAKAIKFQFGGVEYILFEESANWFLATESQFQQM